MPRAQDTAAAAIIILIKIIIVIQMFKAKTKRINTQSVI